MKRALTTDSWGSLVLGHVIFYWIKETAHNENRTEESRRMKRGYCVRKGDGIGKKRRRKGNIVRHYKEVRKKYPILTPIFSPLSFMLPGVESRFQVGGVEGQWNVG